jgi:hypothetical protein
MNLVPLDPGELRAEFKVYEVYMFVNRELAEKLIKLPMYRHLSAGTRLFHVSSHRCPPKKFFGIPRERFPSADELWQADQQSQLLAQKRALELLATPGVRQVVVTWHLRKATASRYKPGHEVSDCVARMTKPEHRWLPGEPHERALAIEQGREE